MNPMARPAFRLVPLISEICCFVNDRIFVIINRVFFLFRVFVYSSSNRWRNCMMDRPPPHTILLKENKATIL